MMWGAMKANFLGAKARLCSYFPDYEVYVRSHGRVRFLKIPTYFQVRFAGVIMVALLAWLVFSGGLILSQYRVHAARTEIAAKAQAVARESSKVEAFRETFDSKASVLEARQARLEGIASKYFGAAALDGKARTMKPPSRDEEAKAMQHPLPEAKRLSRIKQAQLHFADRLTKLALARARSAEAVLRRLGLNPPQSMDPGVAVGGPLIPFGFFHHEPRESGDPFARLSVALGRLDHLERTLLAVPSFMPVRNGRLTSGYGFRFDPFTRWPAMHMGQDFSSPRGEPIHAAASGRVVRAGWSSGYGNLVVIDHGHGLSTAYGHMSKIDVKLNDRVEHGQVVGRVGSTGRSTGEHLHFEVRADGRAINPRLFLEGSADVVEIQTRIKQRLFVPSERS